MSPLEPWRRILAPCLLLAASLSCGGCGEGDDGQRDSAPGDPESGGAASEVPATFTPPADRETREGDGRLPAGEDSVHVPATELFPGGARLDPGAENPLSGDPQAIAAGERHFAAFNCAGCHAPLGGGGMGPPLSDDAWIYGSGPAQIYLSIMQGRPQGMPAWSAMLPQKTAWELVAYIETLPGIEDYAARKGFEAAASRSGSGDGSAEPGNEAADTQDDR